MDTTTEVNSTENTDSATSPTTVKPPTNYVADPTARFRGIGINFRAKVIGIDEVLDSRGDQMCQESLLKLKAAVKASGQHKQKVIVNVSLEGIKLIDQLSGQVEHVHPVHRISFISRDLTDRRAFGYVYGVGDGKHQFFGIKTQKIAESLVLSLRDLFQVVYNMKKKEMESSTNEQESGNEKQTITTTQQEAPQQGGLLDLQTQLNSLQDGIATIDAIQPWDNGATTPDAGFPANDSNGDMFGALWKHCFIEVPALIHPPSSDMLRSKNLLVLPNAPKREDYSSGSSGSSLWPNSTNSSEDRSSTGSNQTSGTSSNIQKSDSYASDLLALNQTAQAAPGSKLTNDQILDGFKGQPTGMGGMGMPQQGYGAPQPGYGMQQGGYGQPNPMGMPQQQGFGMQPNMGIQGGFNNQMQGGFGGQPGFNVGGFQQPPQMAPRRAAPPQPGHMGGGGMMGGTPSPFGDNTAAPSMFPDNSLLTPKSNNPEPEKKEEKQANDPFGDLVGGMGSKSSSKKDMFKDFQMAKPKPPARPSVNASPQENTDKSTSSKFDNFMFNNVGGIPLQTEDEANNNKAPTPAPRQPAAPANDDPFGFDMSGGNATETKASDPFGGGFDQAFDFGANTNNNSNQTAAVNNTNNFDSLFG